jgi:hypothetical protein
MSTTYNAAQIVGKTLYGFTPIALKRFPEDAAPVIYTVPEWAPVGIVDSYLLPKAGRANLYWSFKDQNGKFYYAEHKPGRFDIKAIAAQGGTTTEQLIKDQAKANETTKDFISRNLQTIGIIAAVAYLFKEPIANLFKK